jgi:integrase
MASIFQASGAFHLRLYSSVNVHTGVPNAIGEMGKPMRTQQSVKLVRKDDTLNKTARSTNVLLLANAKEAQIKAWEGRAASSTPGEEMRPSDDMTIADFFDTVFMPQMRLELTPSTIDSYRRYWNAYLRDHFNHTKTLKSYEAFMATNFLESLAATKSKNTVMHARAVASAIFAYAIAKGYIKAATGETKNPWRDARKNIKCQETEELTAYTAAEIETILDALEHVSGREEYSATLAGMLVTVCFYGGLRPSETAGLRWENVDLTLGTIQVCEAFVAGHFKKTTKTEENRTVPMLPQLRNRMKLWAMKWQYPVDGLVFSNQSGDKPININNVSARIIGPTLKKIGLEWKGFYACRRGFGTTLYNMGASMEEIAAAMGNSPDTAFKHYVKDKSITAAKGVARWAALGEDAAMMLTAGGQ